MSRYIGKPESATQANGTVEYGFDHACGYFIQVFDGEDECVVDMDSKFNGLSGSALAGKLQALHIRIPEEHVLSMMMDMPF